MYSKQFIFLRNSLYAIEDLIFTNYKKSPAAIHIHTTHLSHDIKKEREDTNNKIRKSPPISSLPFSFFFKPEKSQIDISDGGPDHLSPQPTMFNISPFPES